MFYNNASGVPYTTAYIQAKGDPLADLYEDIAAEEKARATYQWLIDMTDDGFKEAVQIIIDDRNQNSIPWHYIE
ncbi:hypothetical protein PAECIP111894_00275 [Paenibacillus pseudetheri]|uniref:Uncharacterized protein n=1 Tax=Paenibacillus pseudetheri TaxID=2897682 RepID=A0ABN8F7V5_9BACL|nr:hypothetical protein PAECIP111894_00275 [Paenibacillus pseudetheri]